MSIGVPQPQRLTFVAIHGSYMSRTDEILCPTCGWTGAADDLEPADGEYRCPACDGPVAIE